MTPRRRIIPIFVPHAGCPNNCVFCDQKRISGSPLPADGATVNAALSPLFEQRDLEVAFYGGSFTAVDISLQLELLEAVQPFICSGCVSSIRVSTRPDAINSEALDRLKQYGVKTIELGAQSMDDYVLQKSGRGHAANDTRISAAMIKEAGFNLVLQMMTGLPGSSPESDHETAKEIIRLRPDAVRIYPTVIISGTALEDMRLRGLYSEHSVDEAVALCSELVPLFEAASVPIIRLGLNPTTELSGGAVTGGAYHPAFGELVYSRILLNKVCGALDESCLGKDVTITVAESDISAMNGQHRRNITELMKLFGMRSLKVKGGLQARGTVEIKVEDRT